jgi:hypothetical protein
LLYHAWILASLFQPYGPEAIKLADFCVALLLSAALGSQPFSQFCLNLTRAGHGLSCFWHHWGMHAYIHFVAQQSKRVDINRPLADTHSGLEPVVKHWARVLLDSWWNNHESWVKHVRKSDIDTILIYMIRTPIDVKQDQCRFPFWIPAPYAKVIADAYPHLAPLRPPVWYDQLPIPSFRNLVIALILKYTDERYRTQPDKTVPPDWLSLSEDLIVRLDSVWNTVFDSYSLIWESSDAFERRQESLED